MVDRVVISRGETQVSTNGSEFAAVTEETPQAQPAQAEQSQEQPKQEQPAAQSWQHPKFKTPDDAAKAAEEAQRKITEQAELIKQLQSGQQQPPETSNEDNPDGNQETPKKEELTKEQEADLTKKFEEGFFDKYSQEYYESGELSEESFEELKKHVPESLLKTHMAGYDALMQLRDQKVYEVFGGEEQFAPIAGWAAQNLSEKEVNAFNEAMKNPDIEVAVKEAQAIMFKYTQVNGSEPKLVTGDDPSVETGVYQSTAEMMADMKNPLYKQRGPEGDAFRKKVDQKLARSNVMGNARTVVRGT